MNQEWELFTLFSIPVVKINIGRDFTKSEMDCFKNILMFRDEKIGMQNHRSKDPYLFDNFAEELKDIKIFCEHELKQYLEKIEGIDTDLAELYITQSWLNKTKPGEYHHLHHHTNSYLSGVLYISCLPNDVISLEDRTYGLYNNLVFLKQEPTEWNCKGANINVKERDLILFPSWVPHHVGINETKETERISLSFNTFPIGELGDYDNTTHLKL